VARTLCSPTKATPASMARSAHLYMVSRVLAQEQGLTF